jgi:hypothetical protein
VRIISFLAPLFPFFVAFLSFRLVLSMFPLFPPIASTEFEGAGASLRIFVFFDFSVPMANTNNQILILVRGWIDTQRETRYFELQDSVMNKSADARSNVYSASGHAPFGADQFAPLRHCGSPEQSHASDGRHSIEPTA